MDKDPEASRGITEAGGGLSRGDPLNKEGPQGFVLPMGGVGGLQEPASQG